MTNDLQSKQEHLYGNLNFAVSIKKDNVAIVQHFIESEKEAHEHNFQGKFFPAYHNQLTRVMNTTLSKVSDDDVFLLFYYRLRLGIVDKPLEKHFSLFLKAVKQNLDDGFSFCNLSLSILFGMKQNAESDAVNDVVYSDFLEGLKFIKLCEAYESFFGLRKKSQRFSPFVASSGLMSNIKQGISFYLESDFITAGSLVLLLLDEEKSSKETLLNLHGNNLNNTSVWLLGSFYKDFQSTDENKNILKDLYIKYPKEWIDEYQ